MNSTSYLNNELIRIFDKFQDAIIKYEFKASRNTHLIEVKPLDVYDSESFITQEIELMDNFLAKFPKETILFVSEESMSKVTNPLFIYQKSRLALCFKNNEIVTEPLFDLTNQDFSLGGEYNFFLAA
jgi:phosphorylcholine metabolism protein LicD